MTRATQLADFARVLPGAFALRSELVAWVAANPAPPVGTVVTAGGLQYVREAGATAIVDLPDWLPFGVVYPDHFAENVTPGTTDMTDPFIAALQSGYKKLATTTETYLIRKTVIASLTADLDLEINGTILGDPFDDGVTNWAIEPIMSIDAVIGTGYSVRVTGPGTIDASLRDDVPGTASASGLLIRFAGSLYVGDGLRFIAGVSGDGKGDTGLVPFACKKVIVNGAYFKGWDDHGVYFTGGADPVTADTESREAVVTNCIFEGIRAGDVRVARDHNSINVSNNTTTNCSKLVIISGGDTNWNTAQRITVVGNIINGARNVAIDIRYLRGDAGSIISLNQIYDWGTETQGSAINLRGASNVIVTGNVIRPTVAPPNSISCATGVYMTNAYGVGDQALGEPNETLYIARGNTIFGNSIKIDEGGSRINNRCIKDNTNSTANRIGINTLLNDAPFDVEISSAGSDVTTDTRSLLRQNDSGLGFGGIYPKRTIDISNELAVSRGLDPTESFITLDRSGPNPRLESFSPIGNAGTIEYNSTTDASHTTPTGGGGLGHRFRVRNIVRMQITETSFILFGVPTHADNAAAVSGGVPVGGIYKTADGDLKIRI